MNKLIILMIFSCGMAAFMTDRSFTVSSDSFNQKDKIPERYTVMGKNVSPPLDLDNIPEGTRTLAVVLEDPDTRKGTFVHWVAWNIPVSPLLSENLKQGITGLNGRGENKYTGPFLSENTQRYFFKVYAVDRVLALPNGSDKKALEQALEGHVIGMAQLMGVFN